MVLSFKYKDVKRTNGTRAVSPSIPVTLSGNAGKYTFVALPDSGADVSAIPRSIAELLNLNLKGKKTEKTFGIGGSAKAVETKINVEFGKSHDIHKFSLPVKVILDDYDFPPLIGRAVFFDKFNAHFKQSERRIVLKPAKKSF